jgi:hypothetical protein
LPAGADGAPTLPAQVSRMAVRHGPGAAHDTATAPGLPDAPDLIDRSAGAKLVTRKGRTVTGQTPIADPSPAELPRLMLRHAQMISLRDDRAILAVDASVVEQLWDEVRWVSSGISADIGPVIDLVTSLHHTPKGAVASGMRVLAAETDFEALFRLPQGSHPEERFRMLADTIRKLAPNARRLPDDYAFTRPIGHADSVGLDAALATALLQELRRERED